MKYILLILAVLIAVICVRAQEGSTVEQYFNTNITQQERTQYNTVVYDVSQQLRNNPDSAGLYVTRGIAYAGLGLHVDAINDYNKAIKLDSTIAVAYYNRGISRARFVYNKKACADIKKAAEMGVNEAVDTYNEKCMLYIKELGEVKKK